MLTMEALQGVPSSFKNSCLGNKALNHIESDPVTILHDAFSDRLRVFGNDDIVLKEEQYETVGNDF